MNREIKFRSWAEEVRNSIGKVVYEPRMLYDDIPGDCLRWLFEGQDIHVMQYTGLHDADGVEIYEGDILEHLSGGRTSVVEWWGNGWSENTDKAYHRIVVGNIYENPELV